MFYSLIIAGHLAVVYSSFEEELFFDVMREAKVMKAWLGVRTYEGSRDFITVHDEAIDELHYKNWARFGQYQQPDYKYQLGCVVLVSPSNTAYTKPGMDDMLCNTTAAYICHLKGLLTYNVSIVKTETSTFVESKFFE